jgi:hypothetical protein
MTKKHLIIFLLAVCLFCLSAALIGWSLGYDYAKWVNSQTPHNQVVRDK